MAGGVSTPIGTSGITYNFLDKPELINIVGKGTIQITYDADGNKLQKKFTPVNGTAVTTSYINEFVYQGNTLQYINFEEGRIRAVTPVSVSNGYDGLTIDGNIDLPSLNLPSGGRGAYDYFIRDYQQNVRMILTEEIHTGINACTMELSRAANEEPIFGQAGANNEVVQTRFTPKPAGWASNTTSYVSKLGSLTKKAGPNVLLKVMAGDQLSATTKYYYQNAVTNSTGDNLTAPILTALVQSILGSPATGLAKGNSANISNQLNADAIFKTKTAPDANNATGTNPKAYMTIVFFDERFNYVSTGSTSLRVSQQGNGAAPLVLPNIQAPKNGFAYIYLSNESAEPVYFDDFTVADTRGRIIEEDHYYAYGLKIAGISSKKLPDPNEGNIDNKNLYNDKELFDDADLDWYDYGFRNYDPQIGRFTQLDPLTDEYPELTNYQYASNEPIANVDMDGLESYQSLTPVVVKGLSRAAPAATNAGLSIFKISTKIIPTVSKLAAAHSEASSINRQIQAGIQSQLSVPNEQQGPTISQCCNYFVSEEQKEMYATRTSDAGYNPDGTLNFSARVAQDKTWNNFANNFAWPIIGAAVGEGAGRLLFKGGSLLFEASAKGGSTVEQAGNFAKSWLGEDATSITNKAGDEIFMSKDGLRKMRFDIKSSQGDLPHVHLEKFVNGKWRDALKGIHRIYPK